MAIKSFSIEKVFDFSKTKNKEWVELAYSGDFIHPQTREHFSLSVEDFNEWVRHFTFLSEKGNTVPIVKVHSLDPTDRLGTLTAVEVRDNSFVGQLSWNSEMVEKNLSEVSFSLGIRDNVQESTGERFSSSVIHVGATDYPVLRGLKRNLSTLVLSSEFEKEEFFKPEEKTPPPTTPKPEEKPVAFPAKLLSALSLQADATEDQVVAAAETLKLSAETLKADLESSEKLNEEFFKKSSEDRTARVNSLSCTEEQKTKLLKLCSIDAVKADVKADESQFELLLSFIPAKGGDEANDELFLSDSQNPHGKEGGKLPSLAEFCKPNE